MKREQSYKIGDKVKFEKGRTCLDLRYDHPVEIIQGTIAEMIFYVKAENGDCYEKNVKEVKKAGK